MIYQYGILGFGIAGQLLLLELLKANVSPSQICVIDKHFAGGALATDYSAVLSNTPWQKTRAALEQYPEFSKHIIQEFDTIYQLQQCQPVREIARACYTTAMTAIKLYRIEICATAVLEVIHGSPHSVKHTFGTVQCAKLIVAHGAIEKQLDISTPSIPLSIALDPHLLKHHIKPNYEHVVVFGTAHSGTIILKHLHDLSISTTAVYNTPTPFLFARDDEYDGIKEAAADYADAILRGEYTHCSLMSWSDTLNVFKALQKATKVIYSVGFTARQIVGIPTAYDPMTAKLTGVENIYGFGIAYPGTTEYKGKIYTDVSVASFQQQIQRCLPKILEQN